LKAGNIQKSVYNNEPAILDFDGESDSYIS